MPALEIFGTLASLVIAASLMMKNLKRLRLINLGGSVLFALYGLGIGSVPVFLVNVFIVGIDAWYLYKMRSQRFIFSLLHVPVQDSEYLKSFLAYHEEDIRRFNPDFSGDWDPDAQAIFILRDTVPASLVIWRRRGEGVIDLFLDYASPAYRDYKNAEFFFEAAAKDISKGCETRFYARTAKKAQLHYLRKLGFVEAGKEGEVLPGKGKLYIKTVRTDCEG